MRDVINIGALAVAGVVGGLAILTKADAPHIAFAGTVLTGCFALINRSGVQ